VGGFSGILVAGRGNTITANHATANNEHNINITVWGNVVTGNRTTYGIDHCVCNNAIGPDVGPGIATNTNPDANFYY
jgi:hypothetical protein